MYNSIRFRWLVPPMYPVIRKVYSLILWAQHLRCSLSAARPRPFPLESITWVKLSAAKAFFPASTAAAQLRGFILHSQQSDISHFPRLRRVDGIDRHQRCRMDRWKLCRRRRDRRLRPMEASLHCPSTLRYAWRAAGNRMLRHKRPGPDYRDSSDLRRGLHSVRGRCRSRRPEQRRQLLDVFRTGWRNGRKCSGHQLITGRFSATMSNRMDRVWGHSF